MAQREGVGSVPRGAGKVWLRQQGPKPAWLLFQFPLGLNKAEGRALGYPYQKIRRYPAPLGLLVSASDTGTHPALRKTGICFGSTFISEFFPPDPPAQICSWGRGDRGRAEQPGWGSCREGDALGGAGQQQAPGAGYSRQCPSLI